MNIYIISSEYIEYIWIYWIFDLSIAPVRKVLLCNVCEHLRRSVASGFVALFAVGSTWWSLDGCCLTGAIMNQTWINMVQWLGWAHCWRYIYIGWCITVYHTELKMREITWSIGRPILSCTLTACFEASSGDWQQAVAFLDHVIHLQLSVLALACRVLEKTLKTKRCNDYNGS